MAFPTGPPSRGIGVGIRYPPAPTYRPNAYVPGGSSSAVAQAIQRQGFAQPNVPASPLATPAGKQRIGRPSLTATQVANRSANQALAGPLAQQNAFNTRQDQAISLFAKALLGQLSPIAGQVAGDYNQSIGQQSALAGQAAGFLQNANPGQSVQQLEQQVGAPPEQQAQSAAMLRNTFGGGGAVANYLGGTIPGNQMLADKTAAVTQAQGYPLIAAMGAQQSLASALGTQADARNKLLATRPALYQSALQDVRSNQAARASQAEKLREFGITEGDKRSAALVGIREFNIGEKDKAAAASAKTAAAKTAAQDSARTHFMTWAYSPTVAAQGYSAKTMASIARNVYGLDIGKGFTVSPAAAKASRPITYQDGTGHEFAYDPTTGKTTGFPGAGTPVKPPAPGSGDFTIGNTRYHADGTPFVTNKSAGSSSKWEDRSIPGGGIVRIYPDGTTKVLRKPSKSGSQGGPITLGSASRGYYRYDPSTGKVTPIPIPKGRGASSGSGSGGTGGVGNSLTATEARTETEAIDQGFEQMKTGFTEHVKPGVVDPKTDIVHPPITTRAAAIAQLRLHGFFSSPVLKRIAMARLNHYYPAPDIGAEVPGTIGPSGPP